MNEVQWSISLPEPPMQAIDWCKLQLQEWDCSKFSRVTITKGKPTYGTVYGHCYYPQKGKVETYRISCQVPGPFPGVLRVRKPPAYFEPSQTDVEELECDLMGEGMTIGAHCSATNKGKVTYWLRVTGETKVETLAEGVVWIFGHELFHFLRKSKQISGRNVEHQADKFGDDLLEKWRCLE